MLEDDGAARESANCRPFEAGADARRCQRVTRPWLAELVVVVAGHERDRRRFGEPCERFQGHRIALAHRGQQLGQRASARLLAWHVELPEELPQSLRRRLHRGEIERIAEDDELGAIVPRHALAERGKLPPLPLVREEPGLGALVQMKV